MSKCFVIRVVPLVAVAMFLTAGDSDVLAQDARPAFRAGAATSNITPPLGEPIVGGWTPIPATNIHDELHARCLVLDDGKVKLAFAVCDNVGIPVEVFDLAKQQVHEATGLPASHLLMAATHTHSATTARGPCKVIRETELTDYQKFLAHRISDGAGLGQNRRWPAKDVCGTCRDALICYDASTKCHGNQSGPEEHTKLRPTRRISWDEASIESIARRLELDPNVANPM